MISQKEIDGKPPLIEVSGDSFQKGVQLGLLLGDDINALRALDEQFIHRMPVSDSSLQPRLQKYAALLEQYMPEVHGHLTGIAKGAERSFADILALQYRRELSVDSDDCSLFALNQNGNQLLAQTIDLQHFVAPFGCVVRESDQNGEPETLMYSLTGLAGYLGINKHGLAVGINMVRSTDWQIGVAPYLLVRHLLSLPDVEACIKELARIPRASSRTLVLLDTKQLATVEMSAKTMEFWYSDKIVHTNHYVHPQMATFDADMKTPSTEERLSRLTQLVEQHQGPWQGKQVLETLSDHQGQHGALCCHGNSPLAADTIAAVYMEPLQKRLYAIKGNPCHSKQFYGFEL
ncbi:MAG: C45 family autoproteolytic acyltransferase/hydrolase [Reinekea sp.]